MQLKIIFIWQMVFCLPLCYSQTAPPTGFEVVKTIIPDVELDIRYATNHNFVGLPIEGYQAHTALLTKDAIHALARVQKALEPYGLGLKIYDAYRPQRAVDHFVRWAKIPTDTLMKSQFYPDVSKGLLFKKQYIASHSGHSRGSSVDLTLIEFNSCNELDMGSPYDFFGEASHLDYNNLTLQQRNNRRFLQEIMLKHGFKPYPQEWWHFTLIDEPYPDTYFDFVIQ